ncbi:hypothetical protein PV350_04305 [Streptomyces sp. PA03-6a]|nr:hypothetical protein [Streptomyces sp. PA03-6a]
MDSGTVLPDRPEPTDDNKNGALFAHNPDDDAAGQRWFLQDANDVSNGSNEVVLRSKDGGLPWILNAWSDAINEYPVVTVARFTEETAFAVDDPREVSPKPGS